MAETPAPVASSPGLVQAVRGLGLDLLGLPYRAAVAVRGQLYDAGWRETVRLPLPVISVGNLAAGGTGKTPLVIMLADELLRRGRRPGVVARGYRREPGETLNDEGREIAAALGDLVPQVQDADRVAAAHRLLAAHPRTDVLLLDDGFQHRRVRRDLDIVLLDGREPLARAHLLPRGRLREPPAALSRADLVVITRAEGLMPAARLERALEVARFTAAPLAFTATRVLRIEGLADTDPAALYGLPVALLSGIGAPGAFRATVEDLGAEVRWHVALGDHRPASAERLAALRQRARATGARALLVTRKDAMKLAPAGRAAGAVPVGVVVTAMDIVEGLDAWTAAVGRALGAVGCAG
ncbi:MAG: tetraacyldisaccharide 4'-kinase [Planctomycetota bacterium]